MNKLFIILHFTTSNPIITQQYAYNLAWSDMGQLADKLQNLVSEFQKEGESKLYYIYYELYHKVICILLYSIHI